MGSKSGTVDYRSNSVVLKRNYVVSQCRELFTLVDLKFMGFSILSGNVVQLRTWKTFLYSELLLYFVSSDFARFCIMSSFVICTIYFLSLR